MKKIIINTLKIFSLASIFALAFHFSYAYIDTDTKTYTTLSEIQNLNNIGNNNKYNFKKANVIILSNVGVALSTNVGIKYKQRQNKNLYVDLPTVAKYISKKKYSDNTNNSKHILKISEYYNVLRTDIKQLIDSSYNRAEVLEAYIEQLKYRYKGTIIDIQSLLKKRNQLSRNLKKASENIKKIKIKIDKDFRELDYSQTDINIEKILKYKGEYNYNNTHIVFINQYLKQYQVLNASNRKILDTLINNKEAIIRNTKIVIPSTGIKELRRLKIIIDEKEFKNK